MLLLNDEIIKFVAKKIYVLFEYFRQGGNNNIECPAGLFISIAGRQGGDIMAKAYLFVILIFGSMFNRIEHG